MFNGCGSGDVHQYNGCGQAHQISKLVFSLTETNPARRNVLTANSQTISDDISLFGRLHLIRIRGHMVSDPLLFKQLGHWPYAVDNIRGSGSPACPYVQLRMDVYVRPLRNQADFTIEVEIFQREAWQNQICCQRILQLLRYCIGNWPASELCNRAEVQCTEAVFRLAEAYTQAKREADAADRASLLALINSREHVNLQNGWGACVCPFDKLMSDLNGLDRHEHAYARTPPSLGFLARERLVEMAPNAAQIRQYLRENGFSPNAPAYSRVLRSCLGDSEAEMIARPLVSSDFDRVPMYSSLSVDVLLAQIPNEALFRLFGPEIDLITQLKQTIIPSSPWQFRHYVPSCVNHICSFTLEDRANRPRHYGPFEPICTRQLHGNRVYLRTMELLDKVTYL